MFARVHSAQEDGCRPKGAAIAIHDNFLSTQREQEGMTALKKIMVDIRRARRSEAENLIRGIRDIGYQINLGSSIPLIKDLRIK